MSIHLFTSALRRVVRKMFKKLHLRLISSGYIVKWKASFVICSCKSLEKRRMYYTGCFCARQQGKQRQSEFSGQEQRHHQTQMYLRKNAESATENQTVGSIKGFWFSLEQLSVHDCLICTYLKIQLSLHNTKYLKLSEVIN